MAQGSTCRQRHGAVVVRHGRIVARAVNRWRNDPAVVPEPAGAVSLHAEMRALRQAGVTNGATMYVARARPDGSAGLSAPCPACWAELAAAGIRAAVWTV